YQYNLSCITSPSRAGSRVPLRKSAVQSYRGRFKTHEKTKMRDNESGEDMPFTVDVRGYLYVPEYTEEELLSDTLLCTG
ncbi:Hypothetical protein SMAX5B_016199, partial [Scophthalmus maximus]